MAHIKPCQPNVRHQCINNEAIIQQPTHNTNDEYVSIMYRPYHYEYRDTATDRGTLQLLGWAMNEKSEPVTVRVETFPAFCFVELPGFIGQIPVIWDVASAGMFVSSLQRRFRNEYTGECDLLDFDPSNFGFYKNLYMYCGNQKRPMVRLTFKTLACMDKVKNLLNYMFEIDGLGMIKTNVWETEIDPVRKFLSACSPDPRSTPLLDEKGEPIPDDFREKELTYSCWTRCKGKLVHPDEKISNNELEYIIDWMTVERIPDKECAHMMTYPGVMAFDIESYSNRHQTFPDKNNDSHVAYMISCIYQRLEVTPKGEKPLRYRYGIVLGDCDEIPPDKFENTIIFPVNTEEELVRMMGAIIMYHDPEIITGYNILSFDYPYLNARLGRTGNTWPRISKLKDFDCYIKNNTWSSGAYGHNDINMLICPGRLSIDMLSVTRRDYKMSSYSLNAVAKKFVDKKKHDVSAREMFVIYEKLLNGMKKKDTSYVEYEPPKYDIRDIGDIGEICDSTNDNTLLRKFIHLGYGEKIEKMKLESTIKSLDGNEIFLDLNDQTQLYVLGLEDVRGETREMFISSIRSKVFNKPKKWTNEDDRIVYEEALKEITRVMLYCIQDSELVLDIMDTTHWWLGAVEMAGIVGVNIIVLSTGGQQQRCESQLYHLGAKYGYVLNTRIAPQIPFEGGAVQPPTPGLHRHVITIDFTSLYPSIMRAYNICYTTLVPNAWMNSIPDDMCNITPPINATSEYDPDEDDDDDDEEKKERYRAVGQKGVYGFKYVKKEVLEGLVPRIVGYLCNERSRVKKLMWKEETEGGGKDSVMYIVLDKRQNGLKISANSFFGFLGVREGGKRPLIEGAMSITAWGRQMITKVIEYLKKTYNADIIYGDTDSAMISMPNQIKNQFDAWYWGERIAKEVTERFPPPVNMEFEKVFNVMLSLKKKKYIGILSAKPDEKIYGKFWLRDDGQVMVGDRTTDELIEILGNPIARTKAGDPDPFIRGVLTARRDNCAWARDIYSTITLDILMDTVNGKDHIDTFKSVVHKLCDYAEPLVEGKVSAEDLCISRALGSNYKSNTYFMKIFSDELRKEGKPAQPGDRLEYIVMNRPGVDKLGYKMMLKETYGERFGTDKEEKIDYGYYLEKQIQNHIDQVISIAFKDIIVKLSDIKYRPNNRCKFTDLNELVKLMVRLTNMNQPINLIREAVDQAVGEIKNPTEQPKPKTSFFKILDDDLIEQKSKTPFFKISDDNDEDDIVLTFPLNTNNVNTYSCNYAQMSYNTHMQVIR